MLSSRYYPRSFTVLVIVAMIVLTVPLTSGLINAIRVLQGIAETQRQFATDSLAVTRDTRTLLGYLLDICHEAEVRPLHANSFGVARF